MLMSFILEIFRAVVSPVEAVLGVFLVLLSVLLLIRAKKQRLHAKGVVAGRRSSPTSKPRDPERSICPAGYLLTNFVRPLSCASAA